MDVKRLSIKQGDVENTKNILRSEKERIKRTFKDGEELGRRGNVEREKKRKKENEMKKCNIYRGRGETTNVESLSFFSLVEIEIETRLVAFVVERRLLERGIHGKKTTSSCSDNLAWPNTYRLGHWTFRRIRSALSTFLYVYVIISLLNMALVIVETNQKSTMCISCRSSRSHLSTQDFIHYCFEQVAC